MGGMNLAAFTAPFQYARPVQQETPWDAAARFGQLRALAQAQQLRTQEIAESQQRMQAGALDLQQKQQDFQDQQTMRQAWMDAGGDPDKMFQLATQRGVGPRVLNSTQMALMQAREAKAKLSKADLDNQLEKNDLLHGLLQPVLDEKDPVKQNTLWNQALQTAVSKGYATADEVTQHPYPGPDGVIRYANGLTTDKWLTAQGAAQRGKAAEGELALRTEEWGRKKLDLDRAQAAVDLSQSKDQADYESRLGELPKKIADKFPAKFDRDEVLNVGRTAQQIVAGEAKAEPRNRTEGDWIAIMSDPNASLADKAQAKAALGLFAKQHASDRQAPGVTLMLPNQEGGYTATRVAPGQSVGGGAVTPTQMGTLNVPTANTRGMAEKAPRVIQFVDRINQLLDENEKQLGPLASRWNEFTAGRIGVPNRGYTQLRTDAGLLQTALMQMHVGARGGERIMEHFKGLIDTSMQSPENLRAALGEIRRYAQQVQQEGRPQGADGTTTPQATHRFNPQTGKIEAIP